MYFRTLKMTATRGLFLTALECTKFVFPDPDERAYSAPPDPLAGFKGPTSKGREWREKEGKGEGRGKGTCPLSEILNTGIQLAKFLCSQII